MFQQKDIQLVCFFSPEHGLRGDQQAGEKVQDYTDTKTGLPVYSIYGTRKMPTDEQLETIDTIVYYIQDVGVRFYTYIWSMSYTMEAVANNNKEFIVFDRPNPLNAQTIEGCPNNIDAGLVGRLFSKHDFGIPQRYGMTIGELASMLNEEYLDKKIQKFKVIQMVDYNRNLYFDEIENLQWIMPSPNMEIFFIKQMNHYQINFFFLQKLFSHMPTLSTALVYPGIGIFEGTHVSEGRGTTRPFEIIGSNFTDSYKLAEVLNSKKLPGVLFRPLYFQPTFSKYQNELCGGIQIHVIDRNIYQSVRTGLHVLKTLLQIYDDQVGMMPGIERLFGLSWFDEIIKIESPEDILIGCHDTMEEFKQLRQKHLIYQNNGELFINK